jgi:hypothetical protein
MQFSARQYALSNTKALHSLNTMELRPLKVKSALFEAV